MKVKFTLLIPKNGNWHNSERILIKDLSDVKCKHIGLVSKKDKKHWLYNFGDGYMVGITAEILSSEEKPTPDFAGFEWMVDNIIDHNSPYEKEERFSI